MSSVGVILTFFDDLKTFLPLLALTGRVASMYSKCDKDTSSYPLCGMFGERNMDRSSNPSTVLPTENAKSVLESMLLTANRHNR